MGIGHVPGPLNEGPVCIPKGTWLLAQGLTMVWDHDATSWLLLWVRKNRLNMSWKGILHTTHMSNA